MEFENFKKLLLNAVQKELKNVEVKYIPVKKINGITLTGMVFHSADTELSPTIYMENYFSEFVKGRNLSDIVKDIIRIYKENSLKESIDISFLKNFENIKHKVVFNLVNYKKNDELLKDIPYFPFLDLAIIFKIELKRNEEGAATILITNRLLYLWNISKEELYALALKNTPKLLPYLFKGMREIINDILETDLDLGGESFEMPLTHVITNKYKVNGAGCILYKDLLKDISEHLESDFYILPSSIHEVIITPACGRDREMEELLNQLVEEANSTAVQEDDYLSNHIYYFSRKANQITM